MKIAIIIQRISPGGIKRFIDSLLSEIEKKSKKREKHKFIIFTDDIRQREKFNDLDFVFIKDRNRFIRDYIILPLMIQRYNPDVIIYPKFIIPFTHLFFKSKKINIIHDLAYFEKGLRERPFLERIYMRTFIPISCNIADKVIAVSEYTKKDIIRYLNISKDKIKVVYEGVDKRFKREKDKDTIENILKRHDIKQPFIFYCGSLSPRKNILKTLEALNELKNMIPHNLYISSSISWKDKEVTRYIKSNLSDRVINLGHLTDDELIVMYSAAGLFIYPSLYEGFGLPIIEAQACGCPVITSDKTSCPEITGDAGIKVNPNDTAEINKAILTLINDQKLKENMIKKGYENSKRFRWDKTLKQIIRLCIILDRTI